MLSRYSNDIVRKGTWTCLSCSGGTRASQALIAGSANRSSAHIHQRRHSSSKTPNSSKDEPRAIATPSEPPAKEAKPAAKEGRSATKMNKRKSKDGIPETVGKGIPNRSWMNLPSVPSTGHLHDTDIRVSSFFSMHRPMSITAPVPSESTAAAFSSIFEPKSSQKAKSADVIYALSSAVDRFERAASSAHKQDGQQMTLEEIDLRQAVTQASASNAEQPTHLNLPAKTLHLHLQDLAKEFRPFNVPPVPIPFDPSQQISQDAPEQIEAEIAAKEQHAPMQKSYTTTLTIHEITQSNGQKTYKTHTTPIIEDPSQSDEGVRYFPPAPRHQPFLGRMRGRQLQYLDRLADREVWQAISVKRQRKLKMKKHKYKKLMKRTKNLRRRLDRT